MWLQQGTGLGLSVCHGIMAEHNGRIYVISEPGRGAPFIVELPVVSEEKQLEMAEPVTEEPGKVAKARILVVDDEPTNLQYLSEVFTGEGHEVETVDNCGDALKMIEEAGRVVFITGDVIGSDTMDFLTRTKANFITKPFDIEQLKKDIGRILSESL